MPAVAPRMEPRVEVTVDAASSPGTLSRRGRLLEAMCFAEDVLGVAANAPHEVCDELIRFARAEQLDTGPRDSCI